MTKTDNTQVILNLKKELKELTEKYNEIKEFKYGCQHIIDELDEAKLNIFFMRNALMFYSRFPDSRISETAKIALADKEEEGLI